MSHEDIFGDQFTPAEVRVEIAKMYPQEAEAAWDDMGAKRITLQQYEDRWMELIKRAKTFHFLRHIERMITKKT